MTEPKTNDEIAIKVEGVYKDFDLPHEKQNSIKYKIVHPLKSKTTIEKQHALKDISFEVKKGEFFGIVGRNGSGKSTLLKILAEIYTPTKGKVTVNGSLTPFIELGVGFNPELTGRENVYLNGAMLGFSTKEMEKMYDEVVEFAELEKFMDQKLKNYSSGMQVRLAFSVAIRAKSDILLLDEVLAVGDEAFQRKCFNFFKEIKREGRTVILVTHSMDTVREYCDRAMLLNRSIISFIGEPNKISLEYSKLFLETNSGTKPNLSGLKTRLGNGRALISDINTKVDKNNIEISLKVTKKAESNNHEPIVVGFSLKSPEGKIICGTNSKLINKKIDLKVRNSRVIKWQIQNVLGSGKYSLSLAIVEDDGSFIDWLEDVATINIKRPVSDRMPISLPVELIVT